MAPKRDTYDDAEWAASAGHGPLLSTKPGEAFLMYRHWIWANLQKIAFETAMKDEKPFDTSSCAGRSGTTLRACEGR